MRNRFFWAAALLLGSFASCGLGIKTVSYDVLYQGMSSIDVVPVATSTFKTRLPSVPVRPGFDYPGVGTSLISLYPGSGDETKPTEVFENLLFYHNSVLVRTVEVVDSDFTRYEFTYPLSPTQVHYSYRLNLTEPESDKLAEIPENPGLTNVKIDSSSERVQWSPLVTKNGPATGIKYRAVIQPLGLGFISPSLLLDSEKDVYFADFQNLSPATSYHVTVYFGDMNGYLGYYPTFQFQKQ